MKYFHFTLGPVQGFVAQARRTRDFWAGSFILSWLSAVAMKFVERQGGDIVFPIPDPSFMGAISSGLAGPRQGSIPNRFMAQVKDDFNPESVVTAVRDAWKGLAYEVWKGDLQSLVPENSKTWEIWQRQIHDTPGFWDIEWVLVGEKSAINALDRMKSWRIHLPPDEPGVKCMMMDGWQELSGADRPGSDAKVFWEKIRAQGKSGMTSDLRPGEMLCAIAFVKRRFVRYFKNVQITVIDDLPVRGWSLPSAVPSVHYMAVAPWLAKLIARANESSRSAREVRTSLEQFHRLALKLTGGEHNEWESNIRCVRETDCEHGWKALDGAVFYDAILENKNLWDEGQRKTAREVLRSLQKVRGKAKVEPASPFYAVLLMDGDSLGEQMSEPGKQCSIAESLARFTAGVGDIVYLHNGFLVYAGGDDVLALLPLEDALKCAAELRKHYLACFATTTVATSISAAVEYAHVKMPLTKVLRDAHDLLDNVAKDGRGRDAIACRVWKPGGLAVEWAQPWEIALKDCSLYIELLAEEIRRNQQSEDGNGRIAGKLFYRIRERFALLNPMKDKNGNFMPPVLEDHEAVSLMAAEYLNSGVSMAGTMTEARQIIEPLLDQCRPNIRKVCGERVKLERQPLLEADGALLVRFLAQKGVER